MLRCDSGRLWGEFGCTLGVDADEFTFAAFIFELNEAFDQGEERVVLAAADVVAGLPFGSTLACKDIAAEDLLAAEFLKPKPLCIRVAAVSG